ncbi:MAG: hypothetical protein OEY94_06085 [Alphaproteobacteria bacterium]|nr:hypothetical protein [Alphaproteobacteria bacterium]
MSKNKKLPDFFINAFYESKFRDSLFVIKASGDVVECEKSLDNLLKDIRELTMHGIKILLVYGGGKAMDRASEERGIEVEKIGGRRINKAGNIQILKEIVGGNLSLNITSGMQKHSIEGLSFNAMPVNWADIEAAPKTPEDQFTGGIKAVYPRPIRRLFKVTDFIACACIGTSKDGQILNINADTIATNIAITLKAQKLIYLSNVDGVKIDGETAFMITENDIPKLIKDGTVTGGMQVKMENCKQALEAGVKRIHLINGLRENALHDEIFESVGPGTMILREDERENYLNEIEIQKAIGGK